MILHLIATLWTLSVLFGSLLLLFEMLRQDWDRIVAALRMQPIRRTYHD